MNNQRINIILASIAFIFAIQLGAQETITIPLSNPGQPGKLKLAINSGNITIKGYSGKEVIVKATSRKSKYKNQENKKSKEGLKKIAMDKLEFRAEEDDNYVIVDCGYYQSLDFEVQVPKNFSLKLKTINSGKIYVENVDGAMDVNNMNGPITLKDISGSVSAHALNKDITVNFLEVTPNTPMAFSSLNGTIDITFPKDINADVRIKSERGDLYTDFDLKIKPTKAKYTNTSKENGKAYQVKVEKAIVGSINGGGPEFFFKNYNGDVIIRSN